MELGLRVGLELMLFKTVNEMSGNIHNKFSVVDRLLIFILFHFHFISVLGGAVICKVLHVG